MKSAEHQNQPSQVSSHEELRQSGLSRIRDVPGQKTPIFIHSLFRAGSTYLFHVFRRCPEAFWCYQEPLHELVFFQRDNVHGLEHDHSDAKTKLLRHPRLEKTYFSELIQVWPAWKDVIDEEMIYRAYFDGAHTRMDFWRVLSKAAQTRPVFQECRTAGRIGALKKGLGGYHIYLWRNPWDQWWSFKVTSYFDVAIQMMIRGRSAPAAVAHLLSHLKLPTYSGKDLGGEFSYYAQRPLNSSHSYLIFYLLWCLALQEGLESADLMLNIDRLSDSPPYRSESLKKMEDVSIRGIHFDDCVIPQSFYSKKEKAFFGPLEKQVHGWLLAGGWSQKALDQLLEQRRQFQPECWVTEMNRSDSRQFAEQADRARELAKRLETELAAHANHEADLKVALSLSENRITLLETNVKAKELEAEAARLVREELEAVRVEAAKTAGELTQLAGKVEAGAEQAAKNKEALLSSMGALAQVLGQMRKEGDSRETVRQAEMEAARREERESRQLLQKELQGLLAALKKDAEAKETARKEEMVSLQKMLIEKVTSLMDRQEVKLGEEMAKEEARLALIQAAIEGRAREMAEDREKDVKRLKELGSYLGKVQEMAFDPWLNYIPAPFSWPILLFKARTIKRPAWFPKIENSGEPKKPGFWRRLEQSIRKRKQLVTAAWNFDPIWYLEEYPEVFGAGAEPLRHYMDFGKREGRMKNKSDKGIWVAFIRMVKTLQQRSQAFAPTTFLAQLKGEMWIVSLKQNRGPLIGIVKISARNRHDEVRFSEKTKDKKNHKILLKLPLGLQKISITFEDRYKIRKTLVTRIVNISKAKKNQLIKIDDQNYDEFVDLSAKQPEVSIWRKLEAGFRAKRKKLFSKELGMHQKPNVPLTLNQQAEKIFKEIVRSDT